MKSSVRENETQILQMKPKDETGGRADLRGGGRWMLKNETGDEIADVHEKLVREEQRIGYLQKNRTQLPISEIDKEGAREIDLQRFQNMTSEQVGVEKEAQILRNVIKKVKKDVRENKTQVLQITPEEDVAGGRADLQRGGLWMLENETEDEIDVHEKGAQRLRYVREKVVAPRIGYVRKNKTRFPINEIEEAKIGGVGLQNTTRCQGLGLGSERKAQIVQNVIKKETPVKRGVRENETHVLQIKAEEDVVDGRPDLAQMLENKTKEEVTQRIADVQKKTAERLSDLEEKAGQYERGEGRADLRGEGPWMEKETQVLCNVKKKETKVKNDVQIKPEEGGRWMLENETKEEVAQRIADVHGKMAQKLSDLEENAGQYERGEEVAPRSGYTRERRTQVLINEIDESGVTRLDLQEFHKKEVQVEKAELQERDTRFRQHVMKEKTKDIQEGQILQTKTKEEIKSGRTELQERGVCIQENVTVQKTAGRKRINVPKKTAEILRMKTEEEETMRKRGAHETEEEATMKRADLQEGPSLLVEMKHDGKKVRKRQKTVETLTTAPTKMQLTSEQNYGEHQRLSSSTEVETAAEKKRRLARERQRRRRANLNQEQREAIREYDRQRYWNQPLETLETRRFQTRIRDAKRLLNETEEEATRRRERVRRRAKEILQNETAEEAAARRAVLRERAAQRLKNETAEEAACRKADLRERAARRRQNETTGEAAARRADQRKRAAQRREYEAAARIADLVETATEIVQDKTEKKTAGRKVGLLETAINILHEETENATVARREDLGRNKAQIFQKETKDAAVARIVDLRERTAQILEKKTEKASVN